MSAAMSGRSDVSGLDLGACISAPSTGMIRIRFDGLASRASQPGGASPDTPLRLLRDI
jgi:hypothetical protein